MKLIFFVIATLLPSLLMADNYIDEFPIYLYGDIRPIAAIFNAIAMISGDEIYDVVVQLGILYSVFSIGLGVIKTGELFTATKSGAFTIGTVAILLIPVDVHLVDKRLDKGMLTSYYNDGTLGYEKVSNVPWLTAISPSIATTISSDIIELIENAFSGNTLNYAGMEDIGKVGFASLGFGKTLENIEKIVNTYSFDEMGTVGAATFQRDFKSYLDKCVFPLTTSNPSVKSKLLSPNMDVYSAIAPLEIGLTNLMTILPSGAAGEVGCADFYDTNIKAPLQAMIPDVKSSLNKLLKVPDVMALTGLEKIALADVQSTVFASSTEQLTIFAQNVAAVPLIEATINDYYRGTGVSGQEVANSITATKSTAKIQMEGAGQFKWMAEILPYGLHFMFGVILAASILTIIMAMARGINGGTAIAKSYFGGFIQFEAIRISLALVNNLVLYYSVINAADKLTAFGGNPFAATRIPEYLNYIATMEGIAGILGISAIFIIPAIALKGDVTSAAASLQGLSGRYAGNDLDTARDAISKSSARQKAVGNMMNDEHAMAKLQGMGLNVPPGRAPLEFYNALTNDLSQMSSGVGNMVSQNKMDNFSKGTMKKTVSDVNNTAGYGATANTSSVASVSNQDGQTMGHTTNSTANMRGSTGWNAKDVGRGRALEALSKDFSSMGTSDGVSDNELDQYSKGSSNQGRINANKTLGAGKLNLTSSDMSKIQDVVKAGIESEIGKGAGVQKNYEKYAKDGKNPYRESAEYSELSNVAKTMEKIKAQGNIKNAVDIDSREASQKAVQQEGNVKGFDKALDKEIPKGVKKSDELRNEALKKMSSDSTQLKTEQTLGNVAGLQEILSSPQKLQSFISKALAEAEKVGKRDEVQADFEKSGIIDKNGKVKADGWVKAKSFLSANNMNSHNALIAGGMSFSGALGENSTVQANALNSTMSGDKKDTYENYDNEHKGKHLDYDPIIDIVGNDTAGEVVKGVIAGAGLLGAVDMVSGGKVRKSLSAGKDAIYKSRGRVQGKDGKFYNPNNRADVEEYLDKNKGEKSYLNNQSSSSGRPGSGPNSPHNEFSTNPTTNSATAPNIADDMATSSNNLSNSSTNNNNVPHSNTPNATNFATRADMNAAGVDISNVDTSGKNSTIRGGGLKGLTVGLGLTMATGANASEVFDNTNSELSGIKNSFANGNFSSGLRKSANFLFGENTGNDMAATVVEAGRGNYKSAAAGVFSALGNMGDDLMNLGVAVSNNLVGTNFSEVNLTRNQGTEFMQRFDSQNAVATQPSNVISPIASSAIANAGSQNFTAQTFSQALRQGEVRQEFSAMAQEQMVMANTSGTSLNNSEAMAMQMQEVSNSVKRFDGGSNSNGITKEDFEGLQKELKRFKRSSNR